MKTIKSILIASAFAVGTAFSIGSASAMTLDEIPNADVNLKVEKGVATLFGSVDSQLERDLAERVAKNIDGVDTVRNLLKFKN